MFIKDTSVHLDMRVHKTFSINIEVINAFYEVVPQFQRSRVLDALMLQYLIDEDTRDSVQKIPSETTSLNDNEV
jgi:hypothetical protein